MGTSFQDIIHVVTNTNPIIALILILIGGGTGFGSLTFLSESVFATESYVDSRISGLNYKLDYNFALLRKEKLDDVVFKLEQHKVKNPNTFTELHEVRLHEKTVELEKVKSNIKVYLRHLEGNIR